MKVSVIIVNYNVKYFLEVCLHSVFRAAHKFEVEVIVVDNNSVDGSIEFIRSKYPEVILIPNSDNKGFSKANNQAVAIAKGEYILFLNPDTVMPEDFFEKTLAYMDVHPEAGSLGPRLIDGKGLFAPDGKKSFPKLSVALFKTIGINKLFPKSTYFNAYYAVHVGERETAAVEVLSGCCMLMRASAMEKAGGPFDEEYFMYCEDVDLSYRIMKAGFKNIYYPEVDLIHYKGESTRKMTLSYVKIFNEALVTFVKKHYGKTDARIFIFFINIGIMLRAVLGTLKRAMKILHMPMVDLLILGLTLWGMKEFWVNHIKGMSIIPLPAIYATFPVYLVLWVASMFFSGVYDNPYRALKVVRGMVLGTLVILAYYGLLSPEYRNSRAIIIFTGFSGTVALIALYEILFRLGLINYIPYDKLPKKAVIVAEPSDFDQTANVLQKVHYAPEIAGRVHPVAGDTSALSGLSDMKNMLYASGVNEVIFCTENLSYKDVFTAMQACGGEYEYKIHISGSQSFVGSNSSSTSGDLYMLDKSYNLSDFASSRNKRMVDVVASLLFLIASPMVMWFISSPVQFISNCFSVLFGVKTWVGYPDPKSASSLPKIKKGIITTYNLVNGYEPGDNVKRQSAFTYAQHYNPMIDVALITKNFKHLGRAC